MYKKPPEPEDSINLRGVDAICATRNRRPRHRRPRLAGFQHFRDIFWAVPSVLSGLRRLNLVRAYSIGIVKKKKKSLKNNSHTRTHTPCPDLGVANHMENKSPPVMINSSL